MNLRLDSKQLADIQDRIKASSNVRTVRHMQDEQGERQSAIQRALKAKAAKAVYLPEWKVLRECSDVLERHRNVAFWWRVNTGAMKMDNGRYVKFSFVGASDLMAVSTRGRFIAVECKATGKKPTADQRAFLDNVTKAGGLAVCVDHPGMLALALEEL